MRENVQHAHTIDTLITELTSLRETVGGDAPIIVDYEDLACGISPVGRESGVFVDMYWAECTWAGERFMTPEEHAREERPEDYAEAPADAIMAVFICPTN